MSINLIRFENQIVTPKHDSIQWDDGRNGIVKGCEITHLGANVLRLAGGYLVILGRLIEVSEMDINVEVASSGETNGQMFIRMDLSSDVPVEIVTEATENLTPLTQNKNANYENGIFELQLATYRISETTLSNLQPKAEQLLPIMDTVNEINENLTQVNANLNDVTDQLSNINKIIFEKYNESISFPADTPTTICTIENEGIYLISISSASNANGLLYVNNVLYSDINSYGGNVFLLNASNNTKIGIAGNGTTMSGVRFRFNVLRLK